MSASVTKWSEHPAVRLGAVIAFLALSCAGLVLLVATTGYEVTSRMAETFAAEGGSGAVRSRSGASIHIASTASKHSVIVLPFSNLSTDPDDFLFASNVHRQIVEALSQFADIDVVAGAMRGDATNAGAGNIGAAEIPAAKTVLTGSVQYEGGTLELEVQLTDAATLATLWEFIFSGNALDMFGFQADIVGNVANSLGQAISPEKRQRIAKPPTHSPEAYYAFVRAKELILDGIDGPDSVANRLAVQNLLDEALEFDPGMAVAYAWKALVYSRSKEINPLAGALERSRNDLMNRLAEQNALRALEHDPELGIAHAVLAHLHLESRQFENAQIEADKALALSPTYAEVLAIYALIERDVRQRPEEAISYLERAIAIAPEDPALYAQLASDLARAGRFEDAENNFEKCRALGPNPAICSAG
jgi:TolB-like protein/Tfp pilus assembly protein PilF